MHVVGWLGLACIGAAYAVGAMHYAFTGDASIQLLVVHGVVAACVMGLLVTLRLGLGWRIRAWHLRRALKRRSRPAG